MPLMVPELTEAALGDLRSRAEGRFYLAAKNQLGKDLVVVHSVPFIRTMAKGPPKDGEADFLIFDPNNGFIVIEIKGGGVHWDKVMGTWSTVDAAGVAHKIKDPFRQATSAKFTILEQIKGHPLWKKIRQKKLLIGHAVFFPDIGPAQLRFFTQFPAEVVGGREDTIDLSRWYSRCINYWRGSEPNCDALGSIGMEIVNDIFCRPIEIRLPLRAELAEEESLRIQLTLQQASALRLLSRRRRVAVCGGAGTGKTMLAIQRSKELSSEGKRTLLLCYNRGLADYLQEATQNCKGLRACSFHQLCETQIRTVKLEHNLDLLEEARRVCPNEDEYNVQMPYALARSTEYLPERFDAIVIDEGQDFGEEFWMPILMLLADDEKDVLCVFFDQNQAIYQVSNKFPITEEPYPLTVNCRNTRPIHEAAYSYFKGDTTDPPAIGGSPIRSIISARRDSQAKRIHAEIVRLLIDEDVPPSEIAVLILGQPKADYYDALQPLPLPRGIRWATEMHRQPASIILDTVRRFKGLEAGIVFLWCGVALAAEGRDELLYVGLSRAKSRLYVVGTEELVVSVLKSAERNEKLGSD